MAKFALYSEIHKQHINRGQYFEFREVESGGTVHTVTAGLKKINIL